MTPGHFPDYDTIKENFLTGKWTERMLKSALMCKAITTDQYNEILSAAASQK